MRRSQQPLLPPFSDAGWHCWRSRLFGGCGSAFYVRHMSTIRIFSLLLLVFVIAGCRPTGSSKRQDSPWFNEQIQQTDMSLSVGMVRSNVFTKIGRPSYTVTNAGPYLNWLADHYTYSLSLDIESGFVLSYSNGVMVQKVRFTKQGQ